MFSHKKTKHPKENMTLFKEREAATDVKKGAVQK